MDVLIETEQKKQINVSYPDNVTMDSKFGQLLVRFGCDLTDIGKLVNIKEPLLKRTCQFTVIKSISKKDGNVYPRVIPESVKPI